MATAAALDLDSTALVEESRAWGTRRFAARELRASLVVGGLFPAVAVPLAVLLPETRHPSALVVLALVAGYALVGRVEFEVGSGVAVPTQLVLVPMLFLLPLGLVPLCVTAGLVLHALLDRRSLRRYAERLPLRLVNSWHAIGPVAVLAAFGGSGFSWTRWPVYLGALGAQFALDFASVAARQRLAGRFAAGAQLRFMGTVYLVDAGSRRSRCSSSPRIARGRRSSHSRSSRCSPSSRASARSGSTTRSSSGTRTAGRRCCSATW